MNAAAWAQIIAALIVTAGAIYVGRTAHGTRTQRLQIEDLQADVLAMKRYAFKLAAQLAGVNIKAPEPPHLRSEEWN